MNGRHDDNSSTNRLWMSLKFLVTSHEWVRPEKETRASTTAHYGKSSRLIVMNWNECEHRISMKLYEESARRLLGNVRNRRERKRERKRRKTRRRTMKLSLWNVTLAWKHQLFYIKKNLITCIFFFKVFFVVGIGNRRRLALIIIAQFLLISPAHKLSAWLHSAMREREGRSEHDY